LLEGSKPKQSKEGKSERAKMFSENVGKETLQEKKKRNCMSKTSWKRTQKKKIKAQSWCSQIVF
jgi:hypothetical protein